MQAGISTGKWTLIPMGNGGATTLIEQCLNVCMMTMVARVYKTIDRFATDRYCSLYIDHSATFFQLGFIILLHPEYIILNLWEYEHSKAISFWTLKVFSTCLEKGHV